MRVALAQLNPLVGDLQGNAQGLLEAACTAAAQPPADPTGPLLLVTPELSLWGYPPRDLLLRPSLLVQQTALLDQLAAQLQQQAPQVALLVGIAAPTGSEDLPTLHNAIALLEAGQWRVIYRKQLLPSYDVFDERRYFAAGTDAAVLTWPQISCHQGQPPASSCPWWASAWPWSSKPPAWGRPGRWSMRDWPPGEPTGCWARSAW